MILVFLLALVLPRHSGPPNLSEPTLPARLAVMPAWMRTFSAAECRFSPAPQRLYAVHARNPRHLPLRAMRRARWNMR